jgi:hypothetical protein
MSEMDQKGCAEEKNKPCLEMNKRTFVTTFEVGDRAALDDTVVGLGRKLLHEGSFQLSLAHIVGQLANIQWLRHFDVANINQWCGLVLL